MKTEKVDLEAYETIATWKADLARTARKGVLIKTTWTAYKCYLRRFLKSLDWSVTPDELIEEAREDVGPTQWCNLLVRYNELFSRGAKRKLG